MNLEERLRDAFAQRAEEVEISPGALFEIQRRTSRTRRVPELRLRPAFVLAAAACAAIAVVVSVALTGTDTDPSFDVATPVASAADPPAVSPPPGGTPTTDTPQQAPDPGTPPAAAQAPEEGSGQITTAPAPPAPPAGPQPPATPPPSAEADGGSGAEPDGTAVTPTPESVCPIEPAGDGSGDGTSTAFVTVYFACGESDASPRRRAASANDLATALGVLLNGPNEADTTAGFRGLSGGSDRTAAPAPVNRWVTVDLPANLAEGLDSGTGVTAEQFLAQLNATVFQFPEFAVAEYRLNGDCAAFGALLGQACQVYTRDGDGHAGHTSELTAHTIGDGRPVIRAESSDGAAELGLLVDGTRLTSRRAGGSNATWAEVITTAGQRGWVSTGTLVARPLAMTGDTMFTIESLARRLTSGTNLDSSAFAPGGLVVRWGAGAGDVTVIPTSDAGPQSAWWNRAHDIPSPRDGGTTATPADLFRIDGGGESAVVTINTPGPLGTPHPDFADLAYVSIYQAAVGRSTLPPELTPTPTTTAPTTSDGVELPPPLPGLVEDEVVAEEAPPAPLRAQISVIFDFLAPGGPRIAAVEAIWIEP